MTSVDLIPSIHVRANEVAITFVGAKGVCLMGAGVSPQNRLTIDVISVGAVSAGVIRRKAQGIKILYNGNNGEKVVVSLIGRSGELRFNDLSRHSERVIRLKVKSSRQGF